MQLIFEKCPFKEKGKLSKLFCLVLRGLNFPAGSDTPQNKILRGIRPCRIRPCRVSDPAELSLAGYLDPAEQWQSCVHFIAYTCSAGSDTLLKRSPVGYQTPRNKVLRGIKLRGTTFKNKYFCKFEKEFKNILVCEFGD
jgi:hypothetical protein